MLRMPTLISLSTNAKWTLRGHAYYIPSAGAAVDKADHGRRLGVSSGDSLLELQQRVLEIRRGRRLLAQHAERRSR